MSVELLNLFQAGYLNTGFISTGLWQHEKGKIGDICSVLILKVKEVFIPSINKKCCSQHLDEGVLVMWTKRDTYFINKDTIKLEYIISSV